VIGILNAGQRFTYALQVTSGLSSAFTYQLKEGRTGCESKMMSTVDLKCEKRAIRTDCESEAGKNGVSSGREWREGERRTNWESKMG